MRILLLLLTLGLTVSAQPDKSPSPGARFPEFTLRDQLDRPRTFADIRGSKGAMLVFYRSADW